MDAALLAVLLLICLRLFRLRITPIRCLLFLRFWLASHPFTSIRLETWLTLSTYAHTACRERIELCKGFCLKTHGTLFLRYDVIHDRSIPSVITPGVALTTPRHKLFMTLFYHKKQADRAFLLP